MTTISFTYYAMPLPDGRHIVHLYLSRKEPTWTDSPLEERRSIRDAERIVRDIIGKGDGREGERLLRDGEPPQDAKPIFMFAIGVTWSRKMRMAHYSRVCYQRVEMDALWNPIASLGMEQYDYTMNILRRREKNELMERSAKWDAGSRA